MHYAQLIRATYNGGKYHVLERNKILEEKEFEVKSGVRQGVSCHRFNYVGLKQLPIGEAIKRWKWQ